MKAIVAVLVCGISSAAAAQTVSSRGYPNVDHVLALAPGDTIQVLDRLFVDRAPGARGPRLDVLYATRIPPSNSQARSEEADRLALIVGQDAWQSGARRFTVSICETRACAETREPPKLWYVYEHVGGVWQRLPPD